MNALPQFQHLNLPDGTVRPYRPKPSNFREVYLQIGWDGIEDYFGTNWRVIRRWIEEEGKEQLKADRAAHVESKRAQARKRRKNYIMGRRLSA